MITRARRGGWLAVWLILAAVSSRAQAPPAALWLDAAGRPTPQAHEAIALLTQATVHGLVPDDYGADRLPGLSGAPLEDALTAGMVRYWQDLHLGRVDPRSLGFRLPSPPDAHDFPLMLREAVSSGRVTAATHELAPPLALHRSLMVALARYRALAAMATPLHLPTPKASVKPGMPFTSGRALVARLMAVGDLPLSTLTPDEERYDGPMVEGVRRFQARHGLAEDAALGRATVAALNVPLEERVRQIELALERLRWLPHLREEGLLAVNLPMFRLWGWDRRTPDGVPSFSMNVIVGRALNTQTPVLVADMRRVVFRPYWNVPRSILRGEILPALARDPAYLATHDMEIVDGQRDDSPVVPATPEALTSLAAGTLRLRQRPGPRNSLGLVKFEFPNDDSIYMHGTPAPQLFDRDRRDFSHGCVRVADPARLAEWVLGEEPGWPRERILRLMEGDRPQAVTLSRPRQVVLYYLTAVVMPESGAVHFATDLYGHDRRLQTALARR